MVSVATTQLFNYSMKAVLQYLNEWAELCSSQVFLYTNRWEEALLEWQSKDFQKYAPS